MSSSFFLSPDSYPAAQDSDVGGHLAVKSAHRKLTGYPPELPID